MRQFFARLAEHANLYRSLLGPQGSARIVDYIRRRVTAGTHASTRPTKSGTSVDAPENDHDVLAAFTAGALLGAAIDWLQHDRPRTPAEMAALVCPLLLAIYNSQPIPT